MKKILRKLIIFFLAICSIILLMYNLFYKENNRDFINVHPNRIYESKVKEYVKSSVPSGSQIWNEINYTSSPEELPFPIENDILDYKENDTLDMGNYFNPVQTTLWYNNTSTTSSGSLLIDNLDSKGKSILKVSGAQQNKEIIGEDSPERGKIDKKIQKSIVSDFPNKGEITQELTRRQQVIEQVCKRFNLQRDSTHANSAELGIVTGKGKLTDHVSMTNFYLARSASTMTCLLNKVASTSLAVSLLKADGRTIPDWSQDISPHNAVAVLQPQTEAEFKFARKYFFKFLLVRHPFERLLSAYRDKVERANHWSLKQFREHIKNSLKERARSLNPIKETQVGNPRHMGISEEIIPQDDLKPIDEANTDTFKEGMKHETDVHLQRDRMDSSYRRSQRSVTGSYQTATDDLPELSFEYSQIQLGYANVLRNANYIRKDINEDEQRNSQATSISNWKDKLLLQNVDKDQDFPARSVLKQSKASSGANEMNSVKNLWSENETDTQAKVTFKGHERNVDETHNANDVANQYYSDDEYISNNENYNSISRDIPSFNDFLEYILIPNLTDDRFSSHWSTYWERCSPCSIHYDVIAKLESANQDLKIVHERLGISDEANVRAWYNGSPTSSTPKNITLVKYYSQLDPVIIGRVYRHFVLDFDLFDYDIMDVFRLAGYCVTSNCDEMTTYL